MPATKPNIAALVEQMPEVDHPGKPSTFTGPDPAVAEKIFAEILSGGRASLLELLAILRSPCDEDFKNYKAGYVLHGLALHAGRPGNEKQRRLLAETLASQLGSKTHSKTAKAFLMQELQAVGGKEAVKAIGRHLLDDDLCEPATQVLLSIREGVVEPLRAALPKAKGRNRVTIIQALGVLRDARSATALKKAFEDTDRDVRLAAARALANIGEPSAIDAMLRLADKAEGWERIQLTNACLLLAENCAGAGKKADAARIYVHLRNTRQDPKECYVREAAEKTVGQKSESRTQ
jgi:HEAT repeat protein